MTTTSGRHPGLFERFFPAGEGLTARIGALAGLMVFATTIAAAGWGAYTTSATNRRAADERTHLIAGLLARSAETALARGDDVTELRLDLAEAAAQQQLSMCRLVLADGSVVLDLSPERPTPSAFGPGRPLPATWPDGPVDERGTDLVQARRVEISVPGRGRAFLYVQTPTPARGLTGAQQSGFALIALASLGALLVSYRWMSQRLRTVAAVREALQLAHAGQTATSALVLAPTLGPEAQAWNAILAQRDTLRDEALARRAGEDGSTRPSLGGDLSSACDALWQGLMLIDSRGKILYANGAAANLLGVPRAELAGAEATPLIHDDRIKKAIRDASGGALRTRAQFEVKTGGEDDAERAQRLLTGGGDRRLGTDQKPPARPACVLRYSVRPVRREDQAAVLVLIEDVTQQRVADESRNAFVAHATHELRNPLTNIRLYVEQYSDEGATDPGVRDKCINVIGQEARRLERIVGDMLSVGEIEAGTLRLRSGDVRTDAIFKELRDDLAPQAGAKNITLRFELPPKMPVVKGDRDKIVLAVYNLAANAIKYTPAGGTVTVRLREDQDTLVIDVVDTGIGIREEEQDRIFERFYRSSDARLGTIEGTGLGLTLAREVVRLHGGDIRVSSQIDKGSTFTINLPTSKAA